MSDNLPPIDEAAFRFGIAEALAAGDDMLARILASHLPPITGDIAITEPADGFKDR